jgi:predicted XRE-type DNA-binding protein
MNPTDDICLSSGNVFGDLGLPDAEELNAKAQIAYRICQIIDERKLTQKRAAVVLGIDQPKISNLMHGRLGGFSTDRLFRFLNALDRNVEIVIKRNDNPSAPASIRVFAIA